MLYYGAEDILESMDFNEDNAREKLLKTYNCLLSFRGDKNDGKNKWMSSLLNDTYDLIIDVYADEDDLNTRLKNAGVEHSRLQEDFIDEAIRSKLLYDNITAETWKAGDENNKIVDENLLKAKKRLKALDDQKRNFYKRLDFVREATSIYLKHEWDRAKRGK